MLDVRRHGAEEGQMKLAVIYLLPGDDKGDAARTEREVYEDFGDMNVLIAHEEATSRDRLRREFGPPLYDAIRETPDFRDVDIWEIKAVREITITGPPEMEQKTEVVNFGHGFRVMYKGGFCTPHFQDKGAAQAYIDILDKGLRQPEYVHKAK
jgi:hypothetical protein